MLDKPASDPVFRRVIRLVGRAIGDFGLIEDGDRILVALSGGKDSWTLLFALRHLQRKAPVRFELAAATVHPGHEAFDVHPIENFLANSGIAHASIAGRIIKIVNENLSQGTNPCSFCARLRRGSLYSYARREGWNKIALGHHRDDFVETLMLNLIFNGTIKGMSPHLSADDGANRIIRPLVYVKEDQTRQAAQNLGVPIVGCSCAYSAMSGFRRRWVKDLLGRLEQEVPDIKSNILASMGRVRSRHLFNPVHGSGVKDG
jgi:tRNA 2-thiocytidine biosynthesis protein TtcA